VAAEITVAVRKAFGLAADLVPGDIRKQIDQGEYVDRLAYSADLSRKVQDPATAPALRHAYAVRAREVLRAQPRAKTSQQHADLVAKGAVNRAADLLEQHPMAPVGYATALAAAHRAVAKAKSSPKDQPMPVFDADGRLIGIVDPDDVTPVAGTGSGKQRAPAAVPPGQQAAPAAPDGQVAKAAGRVIVYDQWFRPYTTDRRNIRGGARWGVRKAADDDLVTLYDSAGRPYQVPRSALQSADVQARNTGPVNAGGTTGMGMPRTTGPAAALPGDGPQQRLPGDVPGRQVVKASALGLPCRTLGEAARERRLARIAKATGQDLSVPHVYARNPYAAAGACVCEAPLFHRVHTGDAPGVTFSAAEVKVAKASAWQPQFANSATERWLAAQRRR
jgi:hypothetical protein